MTRLPPVLALLCLGLSSNAVRAPFVLVVGVAVALAHLAVSAPADAQEDMPGGSGPGFRNAANRLRPGMMRALRVCLALACLALGLTTLAESVSAGTQPGTWTAATTDASTARGPVVVDEPSVRPHDTDEDPHKVITEPPDAPTGLTAEPGRVEGEVKLSWDTPPPDIEIDHHDYRYRTSGPWSGWITIPATGTSSNHVGYVNGLSAGVAHTFQVRAIGADDDPSLPSATATATPRGAAQVGARANVAQVVVTLELSPSSIVEDGGVSTVTASVDSVSSTLLTVTVSAEPVTPAVPEDFTLSANRTLAIAAGQLTSTGTVTISANDNTEEGPDKAVTVSGTVAGGTNVTGPTDVTLTITDDDEPTATICTDGLAGDYPCRDIDLMSSLPLNEIGGGRGNDIWGWHDSSTGKEYAIMGRSSGTAFVDISDPLRPIYLGDLRRHSRNSQWRDIKVYRDHAFIVSEGYLSGMQVFDLRQLRTVSSPPVAFSATAHYSGFIKAHNIAINEDSGFAYVLGSTIGSNTCSGGLHMINIQNPANPTSAGCFGGDGYTHDAQCVNYMGPDPDHVGAEICFNSNLDTLTIVDVTNKAAPVMLGREGYPNRRYAHQGWLTEDHAYFLLGDELDEKRVSSVTGTTTYLWDVSDLDSPNFIGTHVSTTRAIDHNQYVAGKYVYQSNYEAGLRILDVTDIANGNLTEVAFFDLVPDSDSPTSLYGTWSNYPFFDSGIVIVSERRRGLFVLRPNLVDSMQPKVARATVDGATLTLTYGEALDESSTPATDAFSVTVDGAVRSVSDISVSGGTVALTLASAATRGQEVTVAYTEPETSPIQDKAENKAPAFESREARNNTAGPPDTPDPPTVTTDSATSLTATWIEPSAMPPVTDYDVQYRIGSSGDFTNWPHTGVALTATIADLTEGTAYEVQVRAVNTEGTSGWSSSGSGTPVAPPNNPPTVSATATTPTIVYGRGTVELDGTASDPDSDTLTYAWTSPGGGSFEDSTALDTTWTAPEKAHAPQDIALTLTATDDGSGHLTDTAEVTVTVLENQRPTASATPENSTVDGGDTVALDGTASDPDTPTLTYAWTSSGGGSFADDSALDTTWTAPPKTNEAQDIELTLTVADDGHDERAAKATVGILVRANEPPAASASPSINTVLGGGTVQLDGTASDPQNDNLTYAWSSDGGGFFWNDSALDTTWTAPAAGLDDRVVMLSLLVTDTASASDVANVRITVRGNQPPTVSVTAMPGTVEGGGTVALDGTASDPEGDYLTYTWSSNGSGSFADDSVLYTTWTAPPKTDAAQSIVLTLTVRDDGAGARAAQAAVRITVPANVPITVPENVPITVPENVPVTVPENVPVTVPGNLPPLGPTFIGGGGGGGGPSGPTPSEADFEWTVKEDIEALDSGHDSPTGMWSDGATLWLLENGDGADDAVYAYDLATGERIEGREFQLDERNRAPRGLWSDGQGVVWVSDSGRNKLFAYDLATGERLEERDIELDKRNAAARGIWSDGETMWVLDGRRDALFAYDLETGEALAEYRLHATNDDPHDLWSDGVTMWVSNHDPKRLFAYRRPALPTEGEAPPGEPQELELVSDEEFDKLSRASNNSPRGIWSDGDVMYVADESDDKIYTFNMPAAIDPRLASLTLEGVDIGEFSAAQREYEGVAADGVSETTVDAGAARDGARVAIEPADADEEAEGHQVALAGVDEIAVTVTSADGSRERVYRLLLGEEEAAEPGLSASCLRGAVSVGFSLLVFEGGSLDDLVSCAEGRHVTALFALHEGEYLPYIVGAPESATVRFRELFAEGVPALLPLVVRSAGPATPAPVAPAPTEPFAACLRGAITEGFTVYEGGSVADLEACARSLGVTAVYALVEGEYVPYFLGAPDFVNAPFRALFPDGLPAATPLTVLGESRARGGGGGGGS